MPHPALQAALDARHDLGKYVSLNLRFLAPDADRVAQREALLADLTQTRRGPGGGVESAPEVWAACRGGLPAAAPEVLQVDAAMKHIQSSLPALLADRLDDDALAALAQAARGVTAALTALTRRLKDSP
ncbi:hypothetical protein L6R46_20230 [Myxococcota bacterium]|nr:hypothetical protein [Myxococcota bacterium]